MPLDPKVPHGDITFPIIGAAMRVHSRIGPGLKERHYQRDPHQLTNENIAQVIVYMAATGLRVGLLLNFGRKRLEYKRILPPKILDGWQTKIGRLLWRPDTAGPMPEISSPANVRIVKPDKNSPNPSPIR